MAKIVLTYGPPGCGKSTWAVQKLSKMKGKTVIVNLDDLRSTMFGSLDNYKYNNDNEKYVRTVQCSQVEELIKKGTNVIIADTNMNPKVLNYWKGFAKANNCIIDVHDFFEEYLKEELFNEMKKVASGAKPTTSASEHEYFYLKKFRKRCKEWNLKRRDSVPDEIIDMMIDKYLLPNYMLKQHTFDPALPWCVVSDVDGTLMHMGDRNPFDESRVIDDTPDYAVCDSVQRDFSVHHGFVFSGRHEGCKADTLTSLSNAGVVPHEICMRADDDSRSDDIVKYELYLKHIHGKYNILRWYDDRDQVVRMLRDVGIKVYQVAPGAF